MQSAFLIAVNNKNTHSPNWEKWVYASESFLGKKDFIPWEKKGKGILKFKTEDEARAWWNEHKKQFDTQDFERRFKTCDIYIIKRIWPEDKDKRKSACRIIKPMKKSPYEN